MKVTMHGLYTALVTPYTAQGEVNKMTLCALLQHQLKGGVDGIVVCGSTGEGNTLEDFERDTVIETAVSVLRGKIPVMVGCGSPSTKQVVNYAKRAQKLGADALLCVTPFYTRPTQEGLYLHFKAVAEATPLPICVYNIAGRTGQNIETATLARIAELPTVIGVKEASGNINQVQDVIEKIALKRPGFLVSSGDDALTIPFISLGCHGLVSVLSNLLPRAMKRLVQSACKGNFDEARALHYALRPLFNACYVETNPIPLKRMLQYAGFDMGPYRLPLCAPTNANDEKIHLTFMASKALIDAEFQEQEQELVLRL